jgi:hypothetical protein
MLGSKVIHKLTIIREKNKIRNTFFVISWSDLALPPNEATLTSKNIKNVAIIKKTIIPIIK